VFFENIRVGLMAGFCERGGELSYSIKGWDILD
jgi:hypothetical protein